MGHSSILKVIWYYCRPSELNGDRLEGAIDQTMMDQALERYPTPQMTRCYTVVSLYLW
jgi:hypothetical protein